MIITVDVARDLDHFPCSSCSFDYVRQQIRPCERLEVQIMRIRLGEPKWNPRDDRWDYFGYPV